MMKIQTMNRKPNKFKSLGQGLTEYAIIIALVAVAVVVTAALLGSGIKQVFCDTLIGINPEYTTSCLGQPEIESSSEGENGGPIAALAAYSSSKGKLYIAARPSDDAVDSINVEGYGSMQYVPQKDVFILVISTDDPPSSVTLNTNTDTSFTIDVSGI